MRDLLKELYENKITEDQAYEIFDDTVSKFHKGIIKLGIFKYLMMDKYEATANLSAISLKETARWRYEGWPTICSKCKQPLNYKEGCWGAKNDKIYHLECPTKKK